MHKKRKYPNIPNDFPDIVRKRRIELDISQTKMAKDLGCSTATIGQLESRKRNFNYIRAKQFVEYLKMTDYVLPIPDLELAEPITRNRDKHPVLHKPFYIHVDGLVIQVLTYRQLGKIHNASIIGDLCQVTN